VLELFLNKPAIASHAFRFGAGSAAVFDDVNGVWVPHKILQKVWRKAQHWQVARLEGQGYFQIDGFAPQPLPEEAKLCLCIDGGEITYRSEVENVIDAGRVVRLDKGYWVDDNGERGQTLYVCADSFVAPDALERQVLTVGSRSRLSALAV
jgi:hypothetical protein